MPSPSGTKGDSHVRTVLPSSSQVSVPSIPSRQYLDPNHQSRYRPRPSLDSVYSDLSELSIYADEIQQSRPLVSQSQDGGPSGSSQIPPRRHTSWWRHWFSAMWNRNKGVIFVLLAQFFASGMSVSARVMETDGSHGKAMHPFQLLLARQSLTSLLSLLYGYYNKVPDFPFGVRKVRFLLVCRGLFGFFGVFGLYMSLLYLPLAEATVLTFLSPVLTCYICSILIPGDTFSRQQLLAGLVSLLGVVFIARPASLFHAFVPSTPASPVDTSSATSNSTVSHTTPSSNFAEQPSATPHQRMISVMLSLLGVVGSCGAYTSIRLIGKSAHPLISINYFSAWCTLVSLIAIVAVPGVDFRLPGNWIEWGLLLSLGTCGFVMQFLLTAGLAHGAPSNTANESHGKTSTGQPTTDAQIRDLSEVDVEHQGDDIALDDISTSVRPKDAPTNNADASSSIEGHKSQDVAPAHKGLNSNTNTNTNKARTSGTRATTMIYSQMLFALAFDKLFWGVQPTLMSWIGSGLILAPAIWVAVAKDKAPDPKQESSDLSSSAGWRDDSVLHESQRRQEESEQSRPLMRATDDHVDDDDDDSGNIAVTTSFAPAVAPGPSGTAQEQAENDRMVLLAADEIQHLKPLTQAEI